MRSESRLYLASALLCLLLTNASAAPIASVVDVSARVTGSGPGGNRNIIPKSSIYLNDNLNANASGNAQIKFIDGTKLVVGPGALITIDELLYSGDKSFKKLTISAVEGTFRFVTGISNKQAYRIETPVGTMGVRGTAFDVAIVNSETHVAVIHGSVRLCSSTGSCQNISGKCSYAVMKRSGISYKGDLRERSQSEKDYFPMLANQSRLNIGFRHRGSSCVSTKFQINPSIPTPQKPSFQRTSITTNPTPTTNSQNRSGKGDNSNPGKGKNSGNNQGTNNPNNSGGNGNGRGYGNNK